MLQSANLTHSRDVLEHQSVRVLDLLGAQLVDAEQLPKARTVTVGQPRGCRLVVIVGMALRPLVLGPPLQEQRDTAATDALGPHVAGVQDLLRATYGDGPEALQAYGELESVAALGTDFKGVACQRALLLFACHREPAVAAHFGDDFARDMERRVLPFITPRFLANQCQAPDAFVVLSLVLAEMWPGERLGNWPRDAQAGAPRCAPEE